VARSLAARVTTTTDPFATGTPRRIKVTCRHCGHSQETWTRRGLRFTCKNPKCGRVQEGPAAVQRLIDRLQPPKPAASATTVKIVSANGAHKPPAAKPPTAAAPTPAAPKASPKPPAPAPPSQLPKKDFVSRVLGF
jgi:ribosomal protein S27E